MADMYAFNGVVRPPIYPTAVYTQRDAETITTLSRATLQRATASGKLQCRYAGRKRLFLGEDLLKFLTEDPVK